MPRTGQFSPAFGEQLADIFGVCAMTWALPRPLVDAVLAVTGRTEQRSRALPAWTVAYFTLAMWLYPSHGYPEVMRLLSAGLARKHQAVQPSPAPSTAAIAKARQRLGPRPLRLLFELVAEPVAAPGATGAFYRQLRLMSLDTIALGVPDSPENRGEYAVASGGASGGLSPRVLIAALAETGTGAVCAAALGSPAGGGAAPARKVLTALTPGQLVVVDRPALGYELWVPTRASGAELLWRAGRSLDLPVLEPLPDGSYRSRLAHPATGGRALPVRVVDFAPAANAAPVRLVCSLLDPAEAPARDLVRLHLRRWRFASLLAQLGAGHGRGCPVLRSKSPAMVEQEVWAMLLAHHALRALVVGGPDEARVPGDQWISR